jgi:hypothetical protein
MSTSLATRSVTIDLSEERFPFFARGRQISINSAIAQLAAGSNHAAIKPGTSPPGATDAPFIGTGFPGPWTIATDGDPNALDDIFVTFTYSLQ